MNKLKLSGDERRKADCVGKMFREDHAEEMASKRRSHKEGTHRERNILKPWVMDPR